MRNGIRPLKQQADIPAKTRSIHSRTRRPIYRDGTGAGGPLKRLSRRRHRRKSSSSKCHNFVGYALGLKAQESAFA